MEEKNKIKKNQKMLNESFDYYKSIKIKSNMLYYKYNMERFIKKYNDNNKNKFIDENIAKEMLYNLSLNICNQLVYNCIYRYTKEDFEFIINFNIDLILADIINIYIEDIIKMKKQEELNKF